MAAFRLLAASVIPPPPAKLPESLWQSVVFLAKQYGVWQTAKPLCLD